MSTVSQVQPGTSVPSVKGRASRWAMASGLWERLRKGRRDNSDESAPRSWQPSNPGQGAPEDAAGSEVASPEQATKSNAVVLGLLAIAALDELFEREGRSQEDGRRVPGL